MSTLETNTNVLVSTSIASSSPSSGLTAEQKEIQRQRAARILAHQFEVTEPFAPVSWLSNCHVQTIGGHLLRSQNLLDNATNSCFYMPRTDNNTNPFTAAAVISRLWNAAFVTPSASSVPTSAADSSASNLAPFWDHRERFSTPDGDWFHADAKFALSFDGSNDEQSAEEKAIPTVLLMHGLGSSSTSPVSIDMARSIVQQGMHCVCLNFRGCSGTPNDLIGGYHLGFTNDLIYFLKLMRDRRHASHISCTIQSALLDRCHGGQVYLAGFSLGANVALKCLGELGARAYTDYNVAGGVALCAPLDQTRNAATLATPGINRAVYTSNLLRSLQQRSQEQWIRLMENKNAQHSSQSDLPFDTKRVMEAQTITEFDDAFIAPIYGFKDCWDYYQQTSSLYFLDQIAVPTLILNVKDDPFFDPTLWPVRKSGDSDQTDNGEYNGNAPIKMIRMEHGGHLGFVFHQVDKSDERLSEGSHAPSWSATQVGRFLKHVQQSDSGKIL